MTNLAYWNFVDGEEGAEVTLSYLIAHADAESRGKNFKAFASDPEWKKAARASGVGRLAQRPQSIYMKATDYSALR